MKKIIIVLLLSALSLNAQTMYKNIYPCLWFDHNAKEAADFYVSVFDNSRIIDENPMVVNFELNGVRFMGLNGGNQFSPTPAVSYFVYCGGDHDKIKTIYEKLSESGMVFFPLDKYDWSEKYAWVQDKFGVNWQLDVDAINHPQTIVPALLFTNEKAMKVKEAVAFYTSVFKEGKILMESPFPDSENLLFTQFKLNNYLFNAMSGGTEKHEFDFSEGNSFVIECDTQAEIDHYWSKFANGGKESMCGWVQDKYGVWWQVIPNILKELMNTPEKAKKVTDAFMKMKKLDIETLRKSAQ